MKDTVIKHPGGYYLVIRKNVITMLDGDVCAAAIFAYLEFETSVEIGRHEHAAQPVEPWLTISMPSLHEHTVGLYSIRSLQERLDWLISIGFLKEDQEFRGSVKNYLFNVTDINKAITEKRRFQAPLFGVRKKTIGKTADGSVGKTADESSAKNTNETGVLNLKVDIPNTGVQTPIVPFPQKTENQNHPPPPPEESTQGQHSPHIAAPPSHIQRLDQDVTFTEIRPETRKLAYSKLKRRMKVGVPAKNKIADAIEALDQSLVSEEVVLEAASTFAEVETFWKDYRDPALAFTKYLSEFESSVSRESFCPELAASQAQSQALLRSSETPTATKRAREPLMAKNNLHVYAERWDAAMPAALRTKKLAKFEMDGLFTADSDEEFRDGYDLIVERCRKCYEAGFGIHNFSWLFSTTKGQDINWRRMLQGGFAWAEKPKSEQSKPKFKSETEILLDGIRERQAKAKANGTNAREHRPIDAANSGVVGVLVGNADDAERPEELGEELIGDC